MIELLSASITQLGPSAQSSAAYDDDAESPEQPQDLSAVLAMIKDGQEIEKVIPEDARAMRKQHIQAIEHHFAGRGTNKRIYDPPGNGHCLFAAVGLALYLSGVEHGDTRKAAVECVLQHWRTFAVHIPHFHEGGQGLWGGY